MEVTIDEAKFHERLSRLRDHWQRECAAGEAEAAGWGGAASALCVPMGAATDGDALYSKSAALHLYLFGYEFPDSIIIITRTNFLFMAAQKKCGYLQHLVAAAPAPTNLKVSLYHKTKDEASNRENFHQMFQLMKASLSGKQAQRLGGLPKAAFEGDFVPAWVAFLEKSGVETVDISAGLGAFFAQKDDVEIDLCRRAAALSNKVMKNRFIARMEDVIDKDLSVSHQELSREVEATIYDPSGIGIKLAADVVESCYSPIIQSGGKYNIKPSAQSNDDNLSYDVVLCSLGARYKNYCSNVSRTFMVDPCPKISNSYAILSELYDKCLEQMVAGNEIRSVVDAARSFLTRRDASLLPLLPKTLGFATGLEFRDSAMLISGTNTAKFVPGMVFVLSVGFQDVPLSEEDRVGAAPNIRKLGNFSLLVSDTVMVQKDGGVPDVLTKASRGFEDVSYNINDKDDEESDEEEDTKPTRATGSEIVIEDGVETRRSLRSGQERKLAEEAAIKRMQRQQELMEKKIADARRRIELGASGQEESDPSLLAAELRTYRSTEEFPKDLSPNRIRVDNEKEAVILPIDGQPVAFHISTIKNVSMPEPDKATYLRINFYTPGQTISKDTPKNMQHLLAKHGHASSFIKELTFRSLDPRYLTQAYRMILELRKRARQREQREEEERDLVVQEKLIRIRDQRVPRLQDLTMRPQISGRKCVGALEAHQNGLRFTSTKGEIVDIMYSNIKHAIYQPCEKSVMVLVHFHLKDYIMVGKKKHKDVQFYTEVVDASLNLEGARRSAYDPDEIDDEQREREMKKRLNAAFKEFCRKVERVAKHYEFDLEFDIPYIELGFYGNCNKEMVFIQPSVKCLVNLTELPFFVIDLSTVEHVHFERVTMATKNFDMTIIFKNFEVLPRTITAIDIHSFDMIQDWLNDVEITYTSGIVSMNWKAIMELVKGDDRFYFDTDEDGEPKPAGWSFLMAGGDDSEDEEEGGEGGDSSYSEDSDEESESEEDDDDSDFDEDDESESDEDDEDEEEEEGQTWEELEQEAQAADRKRRQEEQREDQGDRAKKQARRK